MSALRICTAVILLLVCAPATSQQLNVSTNETAVATPFATPLVVEGIMNADENATQPIPTPEAPSQVPAAGDVPAPTADAAAEITQQIPAEASSMPVPADIANTASPVIESPRVEASPAPVASPSSSPIPLPDLSQVSLLAPGAANYIKQQEEVERTLLTTQRMMVDAWRRRLEDVERDWTAATERANNASGALSLSNAAVNIKLKQAHAAVRAAEAAARASDIAAEKLSEHLSSDGPLPPSGQLNVYSGSNEAALSVVQKLQEAQDATSQAHGIRVNNLLLQQEAQKAKEEAQEKTRIRDEVRTNALHTFDKAAALASSRAREAAERAQKAARELSNQLRIADKAASDAARAEEMHRDPKEVSAALQSSLAQANVAKTLHDLAAAQAHLALFSKRVYDSLAAAAKEIHAVVEGKPLRNSDHVQQLPGPVNALSQWDSLVGPGSELSKLQDIVSAARNIAQQAADGANVAASSDRNDLEGIPRNDTMPLNAGTGPSVSLSHTIGTGASEGDPNLDVAGLVRSAADKDALQVPLVAAASPSPAALQAAATTAATVEAPARFVDRGMMDGLQRLMRHAKGDKVAENQQILSFDFAIEDSLPPVLLDLEDHVRQPAEAAKGGVDDSVASALESLKKTIDGIANGQGYVARANGAAVLPTPSAVAAASSVSSAVAEAVSVVNDTTTTTTQVTVRSVTICANPQSVSQAASDAVQAARTALTSVMGECPHSDEASDRHVVAADVQLSPVTLANPGLAKERAEMGASAGSKAAAKYATQFVGKEFVPTLAGLGAAAGAKAAVLHNDNVTAIGTGEARIADLKVAAEVGARAAIQAVEEYLLVAGLKPATVRSSEVSTTSIVNSTTSVPTSPAPEAPQQTDQQQQQLPAAVFIELHHHRNPTAEGASIPFDEIQNKLSMKFARLMSTISGVSDEAALSNMDGPTRSVGEARFSSVSSEGIGSISNKMDSLVRSLRSSLESIDQRRNSLMAKIQANAATASDVQHSWGGQYMGPFDSSAVTKYEPTPSAAPSAALMSPAQPPVVPTSTASDQNSPGNSTNAGALAVGTESSATATNAGGSQAGAVVESSAPVTSIISASMQPPGALVADAGIGSPAAGAVEALPTSNNQALNVQQSAAVEAARQAGTEAGKQAALDLAKRIADDPKLKQAVAQSMSNNVAAPAAARFRGKLREGNETPTATGDSTALPAANKTEIAETEIPSSHNVTSGQVGDKPETTSFALGGNGTLVTETSNANQTNSNDTSSAHSLSSTQPQVAVGIGINTHQPAHKADEETAIRMDTSGKPIDLLVVPGAAGHVVDVSIKAAGSEGSAPVVSISHKGGATVYVHHEDQQPHVDPTPTARMEVVEPMAPHPETVSPQIVESLSIPTAADAVSDAAVATRVDTVAHVPIAVDSHVPNTYSLDEVNSMLDRTLESIEARLSQSSSRLRGHR